MDMITYDRYIAYVTCVQFMRNLHIHRNVRFRRHLVRTITRYAITRRAMTRWAIICSGSDDIQCHNYMRHYNIDSDPIYPQRSGSDVNYFVPFAGDAKQGPQSSVWLHDANV